MTTAHWVDTTTDEEARTLDRKLWNFVGSPQADGSWVAQAAGPAPEDGEFWYDALNRIKDDPDRRYAMARRHLPLPAAWREMAIALRMKIRSARKEKANYDELLRELYHLAAMSSYAGYGIIERVPYARLASLDLPYDKVGFELLPLLKATDGKWMKEFWGEPSAHVTAAELYSDMLEADKNRIAADKKLEDEERTNRIFERFQLGRQAPQKEPSDPPSRSRRLLGWLFGR